MNSSSAYENKCLDLKCEVNWRESKESNKEISIAWKNLRFEVKQYGGLGRKKQILKRLNGFFEYYSLNGLMGPSGAGKTTLLNCLSGNDQSGLTNESEIYLNSKEKSPISYFISQQVHESIVGRMRVLDIFRYAYRFKNGSSAIGRMDEHIGTVMAELMLPVDILSRHFVQCSGGEQKRIAIGQELMTLNKPTFLFVDEPTTGLDSAAALEVMRCLKQLTVKYRMTIIASIHVPSNEILNLFDKLYVLSKGGACIYSGASNQIEQYLKKEIHFTIPPEQPPIEALLKIACNGIADSNVQALAKQIQKSNYATIHSRQSQLHYLPNGFPTTRKSFSFPDFFIQLLRLFKITFVSKIQLQIYFLFQYFIYFALLTTLFGANMSTGRGCYDFVFEDIDKQNSPNATCNKAEHLYDDAKVRKNEYYIAFVFMLLGFILMCTSALIYSSIVKVFQNEHRNNWYSLCVFYWSATIVSFTELNILSLLNTTLSYFLSNQPAADHGLFNWNRFGHYYLFIWLLCIYMQAIGQLVGIFLVKHVEIAVVVCQILYSLTCPFNGIYIKIERFGSAVMVLLTDWLGLIHITRGLFYAIYGIDRCDSEKEFSWVMFEHSIEANHILYYVIRVLINVSVVRLFTLAFMYYKFNSFTICSRKSRNFANDQMIPIDFDNSINSIDLSRDQNNNVIRIKEESEIKFELFSKHKIIIAFRSLSLYGTSSLFEIGSSLSTKKESFILKDLNGQFCFGTMNALMGTSGAGKTSLLKILNGRCKTRLSDSTRFYLSRFTKIETCFITQEVSGHLMPGLTAKQSMIYASRLKNTNSLVDHEKMALSVLEKLDLMDTVDTKLNLCSGGERKRLALAAELTATVMPNLVCIDEPTSGLDSNSAETVISCLSKLTQLHPITILASIHQPNTSILSMFDQLYVLARGGVCIYSGPPSEIQFSLNPIPQILSTNSQFAIETLIKHSCSDHQDEIVQKLVQLQNDQFISKPQNDIELIEQTQPVPDGVVCNQPRFSLHSVYILTLRFFAYIRGYLWKELLFTYIGYIFYGFAVTLLYDRKMIYITGCINLEDDFNNTCARTAQEVEEEFLLKDNLTYNHFYSCIYLFILLLSSSLSFFREYVYFENEHRNGWYSSGSFYLMKLLLEIIPQIPLNLIYAYLVDIYEDVLPHSFYWPLFYLLALSAIGLQGMAQCLSLLAFNNLTILAILTICTFLFTLMLANFYIPIGDLHYVYQFISNFSIARFMFEGAILLQYGFCRCGSKELQGVLHQMSLEDEDYYHVVKMLVFNLIFYRLLAIYLLIVRANPIENRLKRVNRVLDYREKLEPSKVAQSALGASKQDFSIRLFQK